MVWERSSLDFSLDRAFGEVTRSGVMIGDGSVMSWKLAS